jgi:hypothetical protein
MRREWLANRRLGLVVCRAKAHYFQEQYNSALPEAIV